MDAPGIRSLLIINLVLLIVIGAGLYYVCRESSCQPCQSNTPPCPQSVKDTCHPRTPPPSDCNRPGVEMCGYEKKLEEIDAKFEAVGKSINEIKYQLDEITQESNVEKISLDKVKGCFDQILNLHNEKSKKQWEAMRKKLIEEIGEHCKESEKYLQKTKDDFSCAIEFCKTN